MKEYKFVFQILARFLGIYLVFLLGYELYLGYYLRTELDPFSKMVAHHVVFLQSILGYASYVRANATYLGVDFITQKEWTSIMVEGCNAISVMILFVAFIFAFFKSWKSNIVFSLLGLVGLYLLNVLRIGMLNIIAVTYAPWFHAVHDYVFPCVIYGGVVVLWLVWLRCFILPNFKKDKDGQ